MVRPSRTFVLFPLLALLTTLGPTTSAASAAAQGEWTKKTASAAGEWRIIEEGQGLKLVLGSDFKAKSAPDLKIFLPPETVSELSNKNALEGAVLVAALDWASGAQEYRLPAGVDLGSFSTVIIHCEKYTKLWASGALR